MQWPVAAVHEVGAVGEPSASDRSVVGQPMAIDCMQ